jgi:hypothetical protein
MSEKIPSFETSKKLSPQEQDHIEQAKLFMEDYPAPEVEAFDPEKFAEKISEMDSALTSFEQTHDLEELHTIQLSTVAEALAHTVREAAKANLPAILTIRKFLQEQVDTNSAPSEEFEELKIRHKKILAAIGALNNGRLDHSYR